MSLYRVILEEVSVFLEVIVPVIMRKKLFDVKVESLAPSILTHTTAGTVNIQYSFCLSLYRVIIEEVSVFWEVIVSVIVRKKLFEHASNSECLPRYRCLNPQIQDHLNGNKGREITVD